MYKIIAIFLFFALSVTTGYASTWSELQNPAQALARSRVVQVRHNESRGRQNVVDQVEAIKNQRPSKTPTTKELPCQGVVTSNGILNGKKIQSPSGVDICGFYGIPYAKPPVGDLRFKRPVPNGAWEGTLNATTMPSACPQLPASGGRNSPFYFNVSTSEDCLYLNIWVPLSVFTNKGDESKSAAVMIYIYGGGFTSGAIAMDLYNGATLAADHNVIIATVQYRVGILGFLYMGNDDAPGNLPFIDQNLGMQWINDNIKQFGGNPNEITLFGQSAGSISVSYHIISPLSRGLFQRAILMSGVAISPTAYKSRSENLKDTYTVAQNLGCWSPTDKAAMTPQEMISCLREVDASKFVTLPWKPTLFMDSLTSITVDNYFIPDTPQNLLKCDEGARVDIIIGNVGSEGSLFVLGYYPKYFNPVQTPQFSYDKFVTILRHMFQDRTKEVQDTIIRRFKNWNNFDDGIKNGQQVVNIAGDFTFLCPDVEFAKSWAARGHRVYFYSFTHSPASRHGAPWLGAMHGDDIEYVFGHPIYEKLREQNEKNLSIKITQLFTAFAKTGTPSTNWQQFTPAYPIFLDLNATIISDHTSPHNFGPHAEDCNFWNHDLPLYSSQLEKNTDSPNVCGKCFNRPCSCSKQSCTMGSELHLNSKYSKKPECNDPIYVPQDVKIEVHRN